MNRRKFIRKTGGLAISAGLLGSLASCSDLLDEETALALTTEVPAKFPFKISLAQWSLHKALWSGKLDNLDFAQTAREKFGIGAVEYVNQFFRDKATDTAYLSQMKQRAEDHDVQSVLIMIDLEGSLATLDDSNRLQAVENHYKWVEAAKFLGCHSIRVNAAGKGERQAVANAAVDSLGRLSEFAEKDGIGVIVENHGGYSSDAEWLASVMQQVNKPNCGVLPDFGNFTISLFPPKSYDRYRGVELLMPYAKGVSAKAHDFNSNGEDKATDFRKILQIVKSAGYTGHIGIEYEGYKLSEEAGIKATKKLIIEAGSDL